MIYNMKTETIVNRNFNPNTSISEFKITRTFATRKNSVENNTAG